MRWLMVLILASAMLCSLVACGIENGATSLREVALI